MDARMMYLHALSPIHTGTGQAADVIDLPVARETTTNWPFIPGSSIKGVLRTRCAANGNGKGSALWNAFGPDTANASDGAGALLFGDGRLLCLPVRSLYGTFAWVTCPLALARYARDHTVTTLAVPSLDGLGAVSDDHIVLPNAASPSTVAQGETVYLEDLDLRVRQLPVVTALAETIAGAVFDDAAWHGHFTSRFGVVSDTTFTFLAETATVVTARIQIDDETKTVKQGALWYEEAIPAEAIFSAPLLADARGTVRNAEVLGFVADALGAGGVVQIGGHASVGRGLVRVRLVDGVGEGRP